jgi:hypothetical protein
MVILLLLKKKMKKRNSNITLLLFQGQQIGDSISLAPFPFNSLSAKDLTDKHMQQTSIEFSIYSSQPLLVQNLYKKKRRITKKRRKNHHHCNQKKQNISTTTHYNPQTHPTNRN